MGAQGKATKNSDLASIAEVQSLLRDLCDNGEAGGNLPAWFRFRRTAHQRPDVKDEQPALRGDRPSLSLRKRMPMCRFQSLAEFQGDGALLAELNDGALPTQLPGPVPTGWAAPTLAREQAGSRSLTLLPSRPSTSGSTPQRPRGSDGLRRALSHSRLPHLRSAGPEGSTLAATRQPTPAPDRQSLLAEVTPPPGSGRQWPDMMVRPSSPYELTCARQCMLPKFAKSAQNVFAAGTLDLASSGMGDQQFEALVRDRTLVPLEQLKHWKLRDSRLGDASAEVLAEVLKDNVVLIDLACNRLTADGASRLASLMCDRPLYKLRRLDLSGNSIGDEALGPLMEGLMQSPSLVRLDLNSNYIRDGSNLATLVANHSQLTRLSLRRNYLSGEGTAVLFEGVLKNSKAGFPLADIDIAWNSVGPSNSMRAAQAISAVLRESASLYHCDLSYNGMDADACAILADGIRDNHSLYGLHVVGNAVTMDADGFLTPLDDASIQQQMQGRPSHRFGDLMPMPDALVGTVGIGRRISMSFDPGAAVKVGTSVITGRNGQWSIDDDLRGRDVSERQTACWACEGWERVELEWLVMPDQPEPKAVWAFTSLDAFRKGLRMQRAPGRGQFDVPRFVVARMVPPKWRLQVVFQVDAAIRLPPGCQTSVLNPSVDIRLRACEELPSLDLPRDQLSALVQWDGPIPILRVDCAGIVGRIGSRPSTSASYSGPQSRCRLRSVVLDGLDGGPPVTMLRITETEYKVEVKAARARAFYADFRREDANLYKQCFALDWSRCRLDRLVPDSEFAGISKLFEAQYGKFIALYRRLSALDSNGEFELGVSQLQASEVIVSADLGGDSITKIADIDRFFIAAKVTPNDLKKELVVNNDKTLVRYEFLEFLVRIAHQRFFSRGVVETMTEAVALLLEAIDGQASREKTLTDDLFAELHKEEVDDVCKRHLEVLGDVYKKHSGSRTLPGRPKTMVLIEFQRLLDTLDIYDASFQQRMAGVAFRMGMMTQRDESTSTRFQDMTFLEFIHALGASIFLKENYRKGQMASMLDEFFTNRLPEGLRAASKNTRMTSKRG